MDASTVVDLMRGSGMWSAKTMGVYETALGAAEFTADGLGYIVEAINGVNDLCKSNEAAIPFELGEETRQEAQDLWTSGGDKAALSTGSDTMGPVDNPYWMVGSMKIYLFDPETIYITHVAEPHGQSEDGTDVRLIIPASAVQCADGGTVEEKLSSADGKMYTYFNSRSIPISWDPLSPKIAEKDAFLYGTVDVRFRQNGRACKVRFNGESTARQPAFGSLVPEHSEWSVWGSGFMNDKGLRVFCTIYILKASHQEYASIDLMVMSPDTDYLECDLEKFMITAQINKPST